MGWVCHCCSSGVAHQDPARYEQLELVLKSWCIEVWVVLIEHAEGWLGQTWHGKAKTEDEYDASLRRQEPESLQNNYLLLVTKPIPHGPGWAWRRGR